MKSIFTLLIAAFIFTVNPITINANARQEMKAHALTRKTTAKFVLLCSRTGSSETSYNQQFTIIAPPEYDIEGTIIPLHHIKIVDVKNLPPGITWETNASDSVFMVGEYYCVLLSGICNETGTFPLKIVVDVYIRFFWTTCICYTNYGLNFHFDESHMGPGWHRSIPGKFIRHQCLGLIHSRNEIYI